MDTRSQSADNSHKREKLDTRSADNSHIEVLLLDVDNCIFPMDSGNFKLHKLFYLTPKKIKLNEDFSFETETLRERLLTHHKDFLLDQVKRIQEEKPDRVILALMSARQSYSSYIFDERWPALFILPIFQDFFQKHIPSCEFVIDPILTADIYSNKKNGGAKLAGESYSEILREMVKEEKQSHAGTIHDKTKTTQVIMHAHRAFVCNPNAKKIVLKVYDDNTTIFSWLDDIISANLFVIPKNCYINLIPYVFSNNQKDIDLEEEEDVFPFLRGEGNVCQAYDWFIRYLSMNIKVSSDKMPILKDSEDLEQQHDDNWYLSITTPMYVDEFDHTIIETCYENMEEKFSGIKSTLGSESGYTTAKELLEKGLIPESLFPQKKQIIPESLLIASQQERTELVEEKKINPLPESSLSMTKTSTTSILESVSLALSVASASESSSFASSVASASESSSFASSVASASESSSFASSVASASESSSFASSVASASESSSFASSVASASESSSFASWDASASESSSFASSGASASSSSSSLPSQSIFKQNPSQSLLKPLELTSTTPDQSEINKNDLSKIGAQSSR